MQFLISRQNQDHNQAVNGYQISRVQVNASIKWSSQVGQAQKMVKLQIDRRIRICCINFNFLMANTIQILKQLSASRVEQLKNGRMRVRYVDVEVFVHSLMETHALVCKFWLNKFNSRIMESSAHAFFDFASKPLVCQYLIHSTNSIPKLWNHHHIGII